MSISRHIKDDYNLPNAKHVYERGAISRSLFYAWVGNRPEVVDLMIKGCAYEWAKRVKEDLNRKDFTVKCRCGWWGPVSHLTPDKKCTKCGAQFHPPPPCN